MTKEGIRMEPCVVGNLGFVSVGWALLNLAALVSPRM